jgi:hypothetical protein
MYRNADRERMVRIEVALLKVLSFIHDENLRRVARQKDPLRVERGIRSWQNRVNRANGLNAEAPDNGVVPAKSQP